MHICMTCKLPLSIHTGNICPVGRPLKSAIEQHSVVCDKCKQPWKNHVFGGEYIACPTQLCDKCKNYFSGEKCACGKNEVLNIVTKHFDNLFKNLALFPEYRDKIERKEIYDKLDEKMSQFLNGLKVEYEKAELKEQILNWIKENKPLKTLLDILKLHKYGAYGTNFLIAEIQRKMEGYVTQEKINAS